MEYLVIGLYAFSLMACCLCLWMWYVIECHKDYVTGLRYRILDMEQRMQEVERKRK